MKAEIISIGTELLLGELVDTNSPHIARELPALGIDVYNISISGDNQARLAATIKQAYERSDVVITTGGLGPTEDDLTREAIASVVGEEPYVDDALADHLRGFFASRGYEMPERNLKQAWLLPSGRAIPNPRGTAPGWWVEKAGKHIISMPGPPTEMERMWDHEVRPRLAEISTDSVIISRTIKTIGIGEGTVDEMISPLSKSSNPSIGVYAKNDGIHVRVTAKAPTERDAWLLIEPVEAELNKILGTAVWGRDDDTLASAVGVMLEDRGLKLAVMESCTGGLLANTMADAPGSSEYFVGGIVSYATQVKIDSGVDGELILEHGVVSEQVARAMARAVSERLGSDIGVGITGVAGPAEQEGKPVGTVHIGLWDGQGESGLSYQFNQGRDAVKARAVTMALMLVRRHLLGEMDPMRRTG
jgi:nicotinamide-nucleotide amidase